MKIGGFLKQSFIDYPGNICSVIFTQGCNFRCHYCHNPELIPPHPTQQTLSPKTILNYIKTNTLLDGIVITGGEPTLQPDLIDFCQKIKKLNLKIKLDTNGSNPDIIRQLLPIIDYIAMDIKTHLHSDDYQYFTNTNIDISKIQNSIDIISDSNTPHEFRTTLIKEIHNSEIINSIHTIGNVRFQKYIPKNALSKTFRSYTSFSESELHLLNLPKKLKNNP